MKLRFVFLKSLIITLIIQLSGVISFLSFLSFNFYILNAQSPALPIFTVYRDAAGLENITTSAQSLSWDTEVSENAEIPIISWNTDFDLSVGGHYLVMYSVPVRSSWGSNRSEVQTWLQVNGSQNLEYGYASSYIRRTNNDFEWYNESAAVIDVSAWDTLELQIQKTDTNSATIERTPNRSGINILKLDDAWDYARVKPTAAQTVTTSWQQVDLTSSDELDTWGFSASGSTITLKSAGKYLVTYNVWIVTTGTDRTNDEMRLTLDGTEIDSTRSTAYIRAQNGSFNGIASYVGIIETSTPNQDLELEVRRESTLEWTTHNTIANKTGLTVTKLPDGADYVQIWETWWGTRYYYSFEYSSYFWYNHWTRNWFRAWWSKYFWNRYSRRWRLHVFPLDI